MLPFQMVLWFRILVISLILIKITMKRNTIGVTSFVTIALLYVLLSGCDKKSTNYGLNVIYMPSSAVSGGLNLNYPVPAGLDSATYNFTKDSLFAHNFKIFL